MNKITKSQPEQVPPQQHIIEDQSGAQTLPTQGILVPLDLPGLEILRQFVRPDAVLEICEGRKVEDVQRVLYSPSTSVPLHESCG